MTSAEAKGKFGAPNFPTNLLKYMFIRLNIYYWVDEIQGLN